MRDFMIVSINQPSYLPWLGYFHRIACSDVHVIFDNVQFEKNSFVNRNKVKSANGAIWLTVPVFTKGKFKNNPINELLIDNSTKWRKKHFTSIYFNYKKSKYFSRYIDVFEDLYNREWDKLVDMNMEIIKYFLDELNIQTKLVYSSEMKGSGVKDELVLNICKELNADIYFSGELGKNYLDESIFEKKNISVIYQKYNHSEYKQMNGEFIPYMSIVDLIFNCGSESYDVIMSNNINKVDIEVKFNI